VTTRRSFLVKAAALGLVGAAVWRLRDRVLWPDPAVAFEGGASHSGWLPLASGPHRVVVVLARIGGQTVAALIDSGAQSSVIDAGFADRLGLKASGAIPVVALGVSGEPQLGRSVELSLQLGVMAVRRLRAAVLDLGGIAAASGLGFRLIVGQDLLGQVVADFDFPRRRVAFHARDGYALPAGAQPSPARRKGRELVAPVLIEGAPLEVVVDTGASGALALSSTAAEKLGLLSGRPVGTAASIGFGGLSQNRLVRVASLSFAGRDYRDVAVNIYPPAAGGLVPDGLLGVEMLERHRLIMDHGAGRLYLASGPGRA
jgi:predicted aspartyl protease